MPPRQQLVGVPYALNAGDVRGGDINPHSVSMPNWGLVIDANGYWHGQPFPEGPTGPTGPSGRMALPVPLGTPARRVLSGTLVHGVLSGTPARRVPAAQAARAAPPALPHCAAGMKCALATAWL